MLKHRLLLTILQAVCLLGSASLLAQDKFVLVTSPSKVSDVCGKHGLTQVSQVSSSSSAGVYLVSTFSVDPTIATDSSVTSFEPNRALGVPELSGATIASLTQSTAGILETLPGRTVVSYFGASVPSNYVQQTAAAIVRLSDAQGSKLSGTGIVVAIIDTGVDPSHPLLSPVLVPGFDFTRNLSGSASELLDLDPTVAASLTQSTAGILEGQNLVQLNASTVAILTQSTAGILEGIVPKAFGHGTMTAGLVHLVAPGAKIMPLKAFSADGNSDLFNIIRAIYYAADHGANVISMSFEITQSSPALQNAIQYALSKNVAIVAASGNDGQQILVYPAAYGNVIGVGSTSNQDAKSVFTNFATNAIYVAAPGEGVITSYPGGNYAAGWGTSFSAPLVAGEAAMLLQAKPTMHPGDVANAVSHAQAVQQMGHGRIDLCQALIGLNLGPCPASSTTTSSTSGSTSGGSTAP
ncbi:MAG: S8 family serine peptidase [Acidobacteriia bacterium]|nr:S8 family serine peptidase [Terriglobia bacterium]